MTYHKFTDEENILLLLKWSDDLYANAKLTPEEAKTLLDFINRQKCEIERLTAERDNEHRCYLHICEDLKQAANRNITATSEAIKEFAQRLKQIDAEEEFACYDKWGLTYVDDEKYRNAIDTLAKEMTEGK